MKFFNKAATVIPVAILGMLAFLFPEQAWANQPPGPQMISTEIAILPIMALLTLIGGGYAYMRAMGMKSHWLQNLLGAVFMVIISGISAGIAFILIIIFAIWGFIRGAKMVYWGAFSLKKAIEKQPALSPKLKTRLIASGSALMLISLLAAGAAPVYSMWWPEEREAERALKEIVAYQILRGQVHLGEDGAPRFEAPSFDERGWISFKAMDSISLRNHFSQNPSFKSEFALHPSGKSFKVWITPHGFPPFPYSLPVSVSSFYGDQTGELRMVRVHKDGAKCPEDAPVFYKIDNPDLLKVKDRIVDETVEEKAEEKPVTDEKNIEPVK